MTNPIQLELPDLISLKDYVADFSLTESDKMTNTGFGSSKSPFKSRGLNFAEIRQYQAGDDIRQIDWRVTAKYGKPFTKLYTEEKERQIHIICDLRQNMNFASQGHFKSVVAGRLSVLTAFLAEKQNLTLSYQILSDKIIESPHDTATDVLIPSFLNALIQEKKTDTHSAFQQLLPHLTQMLKPGASVLIFSDFYDISPDDLRILGKLSVKNQIFFIHIYDEMETKLPVGILPFSNGREINSIDTGNKTFQKKFQDSWQANTQQLQQLITKWNMDYLPITTEQNYIKKFLSYCQGE